MLKTTFCIVAIASALQPALFAADQPAEIKIDSRSAQTLKPGIFSTATVWDLGGVKPEDPMLVGLMRSIRPPVLRLPAGNTMNYWDWNAGAVRSPEQLKTERHPGSAPPEPQSRYFQKMGGPMKAERWAQLAKAGGSEPLWGVNVSTSSPEETRTFLLYLKSKNLPASMFELGNELYLSHWRRDVPTVQDYIEKAKVHAKVIRSIFPKAKIAVCVNPNDDRVNGPLVKAAPDKFKPAPLSEWNAGLAKEKFYDAVVIHLYFKSEELEDLSKISADEYIRWSIVRGSAFSIGEILAWPGRVFPGKDVWVTEWSLNNGTYQGAHKDQKNRFLPEHTILSGLFTANFLLISASVPSNVTIANYWQLNGGNEFGMISGEPPKERPALHVFRMLAPAIHECDRIAALTIPQAPRVRGPRKFDVLEAPTVTGFALFRGNELRYLAFVNFTDAKFPVRLALKKAAKIEYLTGDELLPSWNNPNNPSTATWAPKYEVRRADVTLPEVNLERCSFSLIDLTGK